MKFLYKGILIALISVIFIGCGSDTTRENGATAESEKGEFITDKNFLQIAQYHYIKATSNLRIAKKGKSKASRAQYPGQKQGRAKSHKKDVLYVDAVTPFDEYVQKLDISYNSKKIHLTVLNDTVVVSYFDGSKMHSKSLTPKEFSQVNQPQPIKGE